MSTPDGMTLYVARTVGLGDCTAGGVTSTHDTLTLVGTVDAERRTVIPMPREARVFPVTYRSPAVALEVTVVGKPTVHLVPVESDGEGGWVRSTDWYMAGGNYASWSDSRTSAVIAAALGAPFYGAVSVHDRREA
jgi:hypothetical protein